MPIHPTAIVADSAELGENVEIGPYALVEDGVVLGEGTVLEASAQVRKGSVIGRNCRIGSGALVGSDPQSIGFDPTTRSAVQVGDRTVLREYVTIHRSTEEGGFTIVGSDNFLMVGAHIGHDCVVGNHNVIANNCLLGGHVLVGNHCFFGGGSVYHQFVRIGDYVMVQGMAGMSLDMPPYVIAAGVNYVAGINSVGLRRAGFGPDARKEIKEAFRNLYLAGKSVEEVLREVEGQSLTPETAAFYDFLREKSKKPVCIRYRKSKEDI